MTIPATTTLKAPEVHPVRDQLEANLPHFCGTKYLAGDDFPAAVCVQRDIFAWQEIIQAGLKQGKITL